MKHRYIILFFGFIVFISLACKTLSTSEISLSGEDKYLKLREDALNTTPEDLELVIEPNSDIPYGIVLDMAVTNEYTETLISFSNGYSNFLYSNGNEGTIGNDYTTLEKDTKLFVVTSKRFITYMNLTTDFPLPSEDNLIFYVLTPNGIYTSGEVNQFEFGNKEVSYFNLLAPAVPMISEYRNYQ